ncbi:MAG TPA: hypothetical protein VKF59_05720 [Candidatus Dormibacteraeota bacterium]|nr:hypothetical protein [Candidatus Dormibacteraeota bacterium]
MIEMMWYFGSGMSAWTWIVGTLTMLLFWGGLAVLVVWAVSAVTGRRGAEESAEELLKRRLAAGQISLEDYERMRSALRS